MLIVWFKKYHRNCIILNSNKIKNVLMLKGCYNISFNQVDAFSMVLCVSKKWKAGRECSEKKGVWEMKLLIYVQSCSSLILLEQTKTREMNHLEIWNEYLIHKRRRFPPEARIPMGSGNRLFQPYTHVLCWTFQSTFTFYYDQQSSA